MGKSSINGGFNGKIPDKWRFLAGKISSISMGHGFPWLC